MKRIAKTRTFSRRRVLRSAGTVGAAASIAGLSRGVALSKNLDPITMSLGQPDTVQHPDQKVGEKFAALVSEKTNGAIKIKVYGGGQLGSEVNLVSGLQTGIIDFSMQTTGFLEQFYPQMQVLDLPFLFKSRKVAEDLLDGPIGKNLLNLMPAKGVYGLTWGWFGWREVETNNHPVHVPADLKNVKIRIQPGAVFAAAFKAIGAVPTAMDVSEVYLALSQGTISAVELPPVAVVADSKLYEVTKYLSLTNHDYNAGPLMASKVKIDKLSKKHRDAIREAAHEIQPIWRDAIASGTKHAYSFVESKGMKVNKTDYHAFVKATASVYPQFKDKIGVKLYNEVLNAAGH